MFYETKLELMLRLASTFRISTVEDALLDFTEDMSHFEDDLEMEIFKTEVHLVLLDKGINNVSEALKRYDV